jgi:hypothetical protein
MMILQHTCMFMFIDCLKYTLFISTRVFFFNFVTVFLALVVENAGLALNQHAELRQRLSQVPLPCTAMRGMTKIGRY